MLDSGFAFCAGTVVQNIEDILGERELDYILLTHSHYDHVGGSVAAKKRYPNAKIVAHELVKNIFTKEKARALMEQLDGVAAERVGKPCSEPFADLLAVDITVTEGDVLKYGDTTIQVIETPGHTRCCVSYYFKEDSLVLACETTGVGLPPDSIEPCFVISYKMAQDAVRRLQALNAEGVLVSHYKALWGDEARGYWDIAYAVNKETADFLAKRASEGLCLEDIVQSYKKWRYCGELIKTQPEEAFMLNARAMIPRVLQELDVEVAS